VLFLVCSAALPRYIARVTSGEIATIDPTTRVSYGSEMALLRSLFWIVLFLFFTFCFIVLFEHGTHDFVPGFQQEFARIKAFVINQTDKATHPKK
jgi:hypothetical protein